MAKSAAVLVRQRNGFAEKLDEFAGAFYAGLSGKRERLKVKYISATKRHFDDDAYTETSLISLYRADRESDLRAGRTLHGPHKDDLLVYIAGSAPETELAGEPDERVREEEVSEFAARTFGSQGQQRSAVLAIKLAEGEIFKSLTGEYPVFLLDDLLGELDAERRSFLVRLIRDRQAVISCCDRTALPDGTDVAAVHVVDGRYEPE